MIVVVVVLIERPNALHKCHSIAVWPDLVKFRDFDYVLQVFGCNLRVYLVFGKILILLW